PAFANVDRLERFHFIAVCRSERKGWSRLFHIRGGWIEPLCDVRADAAKSQIEEICSAIGDCSSLQSDDLSQAGVENLGLVCAHLFRPRSKRIDAEFIRIDDRFCVDALAGAVGRTARKSVKEESDDDDERSADLTMEAPVSHQ